MRLPVVLSLCLIMALAAPPSFAADAKPADKPTDKPADKPAVPTVPKPQPFKWPIIKSWYDEGEDARAIRAAKLLGSPIAIAWCAEGRSRTHVKRAKASVLPKYFIGLTVTGKVVRRNAKKKNAKTRVAMTNKFLKKVYRASGRGKYPKTPCLFIATWKGEYLGIFEDLRDKRRPKRQKEIKEAAKEYQTKKTAAENEIKTLRDKRGKDVPNNRNEQIANHRKTIRTAYAEAQKKIKRLRGEWPRSIKATVKGVLQKHGRPLKESQAREAWKGLMAARKLWHDGDYDQAIKYYRSVASVANVNARMELAVELKRDAAAINHRGAKQLRAAEEQFEMGELDAAKAGVRKIHSAYKGFETAENAKTLFDQIRVAQGERGVAVKDVKKDPIEDPPKKTTVNDKKDDDDDKKDDDGKKDDGDDNKKGEDDEDYEDDF